MQRFAMVAGTVFTVVAAAWALRFAIAIPIIVNGYDVPVWFSAFPLLASGSLAIWAFRLARTSAA